MIRLYTIGTELGYHADAVAQLRKEGSPLPWPLTQRLQLEEFEAFLQTPRAKEERLAIEKTEKRQWKVQEQMKMCYRSHLHFQYGGTIWYDVLCQLQEVPAFIVHHVNTNIAGKIHFHEQRQPTLQDTEITLQKLAELAGKNRSQLLRGTEDAGILHGKTLNDLREVAYMYYQNLRRADEEFVDGKPSMSRAEWEKTLAKEQALHP